ncbi:MAG TPA: tRNA adenosine(34) deaminase TadA [Solirubrobacteraceae bacterium]|nr:tRNA adenosine(34) deaminase TadA [Solirubrobacteraceae bacterium]
MDANATGALAQSAVVAYNAARIKVRANARRVVGRAVGRRMVSCNDEALALREEALSQTPRVRPMSERFFPRDDYFMRMALREAERALEHDDVPIGAVLVRDGELVATGHNERELRQDPTAHAEILALREAARAVGSWRLLDTVLYVTLEPCAMCAGAIVLARLPRVVYGASDPKAGACGSVLDVLGEPRLNHRPDVAGGLLASEGGELLSEFFASRR